MAKLKPWFHVIQPREDLREGRPLDASEFAVHLDHVRENRAPKDYQEPGRFFERTYLTKNLKDLAAQTVRRLSGITVETSAVFNMATQFGGGKTHSLTLLYHLARVGTGGAGLAGRRRDPGTSPGQAGAQGGDGGVRRDRVRLLHRSRRQRRAPPEDALGRDRLATRRGEGVRRGRPPRRGRCRAGRRRDPGIPPRRSDPHPDGRAAQLHQPLPQPPEEARRSVPQLPPQPLGRSPRPQEPRPVRLDPGLGAGDDARGPAGITSRSRSCSTGSARR